MIDLRSDTFTLPTSDMLDSISEAALGDDTYGEDPTVRQLEELSAEQLGKDAACLMPSGTMANLAAILAHCPRGTKLLVGDASDVYVYEAGGASAFGGVVLEPLPTDQDGTIAIDAFERALAADLSDPQFARPSLVCLENPHNLCGGQVLGLDYLVGVRGLAASFGLPVHLDGSRIFNAAIALGVEASEIAAHADSVQFCLSKGLSAPVGSVLAGERPFIERAHRVRKALGGGMRQAGVVAAPGIVALRHMVSRLAEDHEHARRLADGLAELPGVELDPAAVHTNVVLFGTGPSGYDPDGLIDAAREERVLLSQLGHGKVRAVFHAGITSADAERALRVLRGLLG